MWYKSESASRPAKLETIGKFTYVRKNIVEEQREREDETMTMYVYDERIFTNEEYSAYAEMQQNKADIDYIAMMCDVELED